MKKIQILFFFIALSFSAVFANSKLHLEVKGMHCGGCEMKFKSVAAKIAGVTEVTSISAETGKAEIVYDEKIISDEKLVAALAAQTGFSVSASTAKGTVAVAGTPNGCCSKGQGSPACKEGSSKKSKKHSKSVD